MEAEGAALGRWRAFQRRWALGRSFDDDKTIALALAYLRRMRSIARAQLLRVLPVGKLHDLMQWVPPS